MIKEKGLNLLLEDQQTCTADETKRVHDELQLNLIHLCAESGLRCAGSFGVMEEKGLK